MSVGLQVILDALSELADTAYQERVWAGHSVAEMSSFDECVERLFDDSGLATALGRSTVFGGEADALLRDLSRRVDSIESARPIDCLLTDSALVECRLLAARILQVLQHPADGPGGAKLP